MTPEHEEKIRLRALEIWREQGCPEGRAGEHWEQAERELAGGSQSGGDKPEEAAETPEAGRAG